MIGRRTSILVAAMVALGVVAPTPVAAAECALSAPAYVNVGSPLTIEGTGFPASTDVDIEISIDGSASDSFIVQSDASGNLEIAMTPEAVDIGVTTLQAQSGSACTASVTYTVLAAGATPPPATPEPSDASGTGGEAEAPRTDATLLRDAPASTSTLAVALALVALGGAGLLLARPARRR